MFDKDLYREIWMAISKNKWRSILTAFGVFWGIFMLIALSGAGNGLKNGINNQLEGMATNSSFLWAEPTSVAYNGYKEGRQWIFNNNDMQSIQHNISGIKYIVPRLQGWNISSTNNTLYKDKYGTFTINGDFPQLIKVEPLIISEGRFINQNDIKYNKKVCVIGTRVKEELFGDTISPIGEFIRVSGVNFQVVGVSGVKNENISFGSDKRKTITLPFTTMQQTFNYGDEVHFFSFTADDGYSAAVVEEHIIALLKKRHDISPDDNIAVGHFNLEKEFKKINNLFLGIRVLTFIVGLGTLLAGVIGIMNIMLVIVKERTQEIGIKRALGASPYKIIRQILLESAFITFLAGYFGLVLGILLNEGLGAALSGEQSGGMFLNPGISLSAGLFYVFLMVFMGALAGVLPAYRAIKVKLIDALRYE